MKEPEKQFPVYVRTEYDKAKRELLAEAVKGMTAEQIREVLFEMDNWNEDLPDFFFYDCDSCIKENPELEKMFVDGLCYCHTIKKGLCNEKYMQYYNKMCEKVGMTYGERMKKWLAGDIMSCCPEKCAEYSITIDTASDFYAQDDEAEE